MSDFPVVQFQASKAMLSLLVEAVDEKLRRWRVLFVATLELTLEIEMGED
jgi:hypothetical protein